MSLIPLLPLFHRLNREHFNSSLAIEMHPRVSLRWSDGRLKKTAGFYRRYLYDSNKKRSEIVLSRPILEKLPLSATESTLCHEMIHAWIDLVLQVKETHGSNFHSRMNAINDSQQDFKVSVRHVFPVSLDTYKWLAKCTSCGLSFPYKRIVRNAACRRCCETHHGGLWHPNYLLKYEQASK